MFWGCGAGGTVLKKYHFCADVKCWCWVEYEELHTWFCHALNDLKFG